MYTLDTRKQTQGAVDAKNAEALPCAIEGEEERV